MTVADPRQTARFLGAFFDELAKWGVHDVVVSPGSRSTPLSMVAYELSCRAPERMRVYVDVDERGAAFFALGLAKASGRPAAIVCTSGSAVANYYPAVMEAESSRVPLVVLTGDRPPQLQGLGAPQTCDQLHAYGSHVRAFWAMPLPAADEQSLRFARQAAREACIASMGACPSPSQARGAAGSETAHQRIAGACFGGPVHLNFPFDEPLKPDTKLDDLFDGGLAPAPANDAAHGLVQPQGHISGAAAADMARTLQVNDALLLAGEGSCATIEDAKAVMEFARAFAMPVLADPLSGLRCCPDELLVENYDSVFETGGEVADEQLNPQVIVRFGRYPISKKATQWARRLEEAGALQIVVDPLETRDTNAGTTAFVRAMPVDFARSMTHAERTEGGPAAVAAKEHAFAAAWPRANAEAAGRIFAADTAANQQADAFEGAYVRRVLQLAPEGSCLFAANSMSVRAVDTFYLKGDKRLCVLANRGLNGIDGTVSTALGAAQLFERTTLVVGDLTMLHDINALALQRELRVQRQLAAGRTPGETTPDSNVEVQAQRLGITIVLLNNNGGGIFDMLPQKSSEAYFERLFLTPQDVNFQAAAAAFGVPYAKVDTLQAFDQAYCETLDVPGISLIEVPVPLEGICERYGRFW
ncbi:2-succinyl-5-enolpyruvyl-6-hydroxy-3-cyclohexene-1-carboxylic-acid synthase [uncultured Senegalimassilia sp.]|uniref:2-succinyl-5-enolpyruvyl-6-hydroxy-3- cyclohexene-1-carboxylic-acid synthase n=1 Tax=uncultured Senegalimassilia sp. TaxID=1714350 RepID=UPI0026711989|nr:2-succinyl-5-enolpyruvyl-6-hydroxy-3-cyclohexene-1-carboxylic-acid synthase [uncultured Senegalimassilia sp.]